jgi:tetratricopeptide (TPR) repeat protein
MKAESGKPASRTGVSSAFEAPLRLLRQTKTTAAALALLEKGIEYIFQRDFKRARAELKMLLETYPGELDILARARSYMQICDREEVSQKKPAITTDQLYALGVLEHNRANYDMAISYFLQSLENHPDADYIYYSVAASHAMKGNLAESMENLRKAVALNEDSRIYAKNDSDFSALQTQKEFAELVGINPTPAAEPR